MEITQKKPYERPSLKEVKLIPEEAVLTNCKTATGRGTTTRACSANRLCAGRTSANGS